VRLATSAKISPGADMVSKISTLHNIDTYLGHPICVALSLWCALIRFLRGLIGKSPQSKPEPQRILVIKFFGLGSIAYSTLIVQDLRRQYGDVHIALLTFSQNRRFVEHLSQFDEIITVADSNPGRFVFDTLRTMWANFSHPYDIAIDLEYFSKYTTIHAVMTRAPKRIGFYQTSLWRHYTYTHHCHFNTAKHIRRIYGMISELAGVEKSTATPSPIPISDEIIQHVQGILKSEGWDESAIVGVNVNASDLALGRRWPAQRFASLIEQIIAKKNCWIILTGSPDEKEYTDQCLNLVAESHRAKIRNLAGKLDIIEFMALLKILDLFVTNDSGPMIFASLLKTPCISLWGPGDPKMYAGSSSTQSTVYSDYPCSPCMYIPATYAGYFCNHQFPCMSAISLEDVAKATMARLEKI